MLRRTSKILKSKTILQLLNKYLTDQCNVEICDIYICIWWSNYFVMVIYIDYNMTFFALYYARPDDALLKAPSTHYRMLQVQWMLVDRIAPISMTIILSGYFRTLSNAKDFLEKICQLTVPVILERAPLIRCQMNQYYKRKDATAFSHMFYTDWHHYNIFHWNWKLRHI